MGLTPPVDFEQLMKETKEWIKKKEDVELQLKELEQVLTTAGVGMNDPLVDNSGFPRADLDVATIRTTRNQVHRLRNDVHGITAEIEKLLTELHQAKRDQVQQAPSTPSDDDNAIPFAIVNAVAPDSPAYSAGLRRQQKIVEFGPIKRANSERLQALNLYVSQHENQPIQVRVIEEGGNRLSLTVTPKSGWGGRGTLGCHLLPL